MASLPPVHQAAGERSLYALALDYLREALGPGSDGPAPGATADAPRGPSPDARGPCDPLQGAPAAPPRRPGEDA